MLRAAGLAPREHAFPDHHAYAAQDLDFGDDAPVLMTALTAGIGLIPLVVGGQEPGREILYPVATVILGGLITSTLCEFLIHPGLFWKFSGKDAERLVRLTHDNSLDS